jgi:hypothetical protein
VLWCKPCLEATAPPKPKLSRNDIAITVAGFSILGAGFVVGSLAGNVYVALPLIGLGLFALAFLHFTAKQIGLFLAGLLALALLILLALFAWKWLLAVLVIVCLFAALHDVITSAVAEGMRRSR